jgi:hypothetical protein
MEQTVLFSGVRHVPTSLLMERATANSVKLINNTQREKNSPPPQEREQWQQK